MASITRSLGNQTSDTKKSPDLSQSPPEQHNLRAVFYCIVRDSHRGTVSVRGADRAGRDARRKKICDLVFRQIDAICDPGRAT